MNRVQVLIDGSPVYDSGVPAPTPTPVPSDNPYVAWKASGLTLKDVCDYELHIGLPRRLNDQQWAQALAAGYLRTDLDDTGGGEDLSYRYGPVMNWEKPGDIYYFEGVGGVKSFTVPPGYEGLITLETVANPNSRHTSATSTLDGGEPVVLRSMGGITHQVHLAPGTHQYAVSLDVAGGCTVVLRHSP